MYFQFKYHSHCQTFGRNSQKASNPSTKYAANKAMASKAKLFVSFVQCRPWKLPPPPLTSLPRRIVADHATNRTMLQALQFYAGGTRVLFYFYVLLLTTPMAINFNAYTYTCVRTYRYVLHDWIHDCKNETCHMSGCEWNG